MAYKIVSKKQLSENVFTIEVQAPLIARAGKPGQFIIIGISSDYSERIPLTIAAADPKKGTIRLIFQRVGKSTAQMRLESRVKLHPRISLWKNHC